ncbi:putative na+ h+ protein [Botrytis fragariae]|uniref:Putative na+ h+ protein n=1 Tax=Botrytis fragariae TaxID=1964551 RepID=A0A8H6AQ32_9HELO|nr:putative na+ h+ protein [Botrytis fragariae]KAF5871721.1 putative na+ h+ protein [Botrytis fragariae]
MPFLPYEEPGIEVILSLTSFIVLLNITRYILDRLLYCGIIGQILIGIIWGLPVGGTAWLTKGYQETIQALGYLGLIGLVFEGGLSTDLKQLRKAAYISISVATVGLLVPIALSFLLLILPFPSSSGTVYPTPLAAFSAGASLCSTSLGTTFAILSSANMQHTRVGVILVGAAMMDDVVGLVMVNIVTTLGSGGMGGWPIARPIVASFGLLLVSLGLGAYLLKPIWLYLVKCSQPKTVANVSTGGKSDIKEIALKQVRRIPNLGFLLSTLILIIFVTIASFIDASVLFAAFIAGGVVNYLWDVGNRSIEEEPRSNPAQVMYEEYYKPIMDFILVPFFFASIGFSIPITDMFKASIVWKGIVYSILMVIAKCLVSLVMYFEYFAKSWSKPRETQSSAPESTRPPHLEALLVGFAMVARGEIGFLIASLSQSSGTLLLKNQQNTAIVSGEAVFLVIVWAVVICTIVGPVVVGILVRRIRNQALDIH